MGKFSFSKIYSDCWKHLKFCKFQIYWITAIFFVFSIIGFFVPFPEEVMSMVLDYIRQILMQTQGLSMPELILFIFRNNLQASLIGMLFGIVLGVVPVFFAVFNGVILGIVSSLTVSERGFSSLFSLLPHGIFELPAVFISLGLGLKLGSFIFQKDKRRFFKRSVISSLKVFVFIVIPLLLIASVIEGTLIFLIN